MATEQLSSAKFFRMNMNFKLKRSGRSRRSDGLIGASYTHVHKWWAEQLLEGVLGVCILLAGNVDGALHFPHLTPRSSERLSITQCHSRGEVLMVIFGEVPYVKRRTEIIALRKGDRHDRRDFERKRRKNGSEGEVPQIQFLLQQFRVRINRKGTCFSNSATIPPSRVIHSRCMFFLLQYLYPA